MATAALPRFPLQKNDSLVFSAVLQDDQGAPIAIDAGELTVRGGLTTTPVVYQAPADLTQAAQGIALFAIPPDALSVAGQHLAAIVLSQGTVLKQTGSFVIDVLDHA